MKVHPEHIKQIVPNVDEVLRPIAAQDFLVLQASEVARIRSGRLLEEEMLWAMARYALDSSDADIVVEARRAGVANPVTADLDLWRAALDMDVFIGRN